MVSPRFLSTLLFSVSTVLAATADDWRQRTIYQLVTDRFGLPDESFPACDPASAQYCGGTWRGVEKHLDYIQDMGFDAIWISPVAKNIEGDTGDGEAYHGYWTQDLFSLNKHFGNKDDLNSMIAAAHKRGMYVMADVVVNHMAGKLADISTEQESSFSDFFPLSTNDSFHPLCWVSDYTNQTEVEQCWLGKDTSVALYDINTEHHKTMLQLDDFVAGLVSNYSFDGVRLDSVKHVQKDFWPQLVEAAGTFAMGEVRSDNVSYIANYTDAMPGVLDYPSFFAVREAFSSTKGNMSAIVDVMNASRQHYEGDEFLTGAFIENHDYPRMFNLTSDKALVKNALAFNFIHDGIPILYQGQEQGYSGGNTPSNHEALWLSRYDTRHDMYRTVTALNKARKQAVNAGKRFLVTAMDFIKQEQPGVMAVSKPPLLALLTNAGSGGASAWDVPKVYKPGTELVDVLSCRTYNAGDDGGVQMSSTGGMPHVLIPSAHLSHSGGLCTTEANAAPRRVGTPLGATVLLGFIGFWLL
ncbi:glycoside hydrolase family 13 protein [Schizophyllum amplum]|uniref:alpha-amylase n=1 Tax=Schizophyllum amplum TaxID=97359 RepID=A0A550CEM1_9AGAR|nr:glycoside hydrolase family 13 protein [Auriculariopsis ampla]